MNDLWWEPQFDPSAKEGLFPAAKGQPFCAEDLSLLRCKYEAFHHCLIVSEWPSRIVEKPFASSLLPTSLEQQLVWKKTKTSCVCCCGWAITAKDQESFSLKVLCHGGKITISWLIQYDMCLLPSQLSCHIVSSLWAKGLCQYAGSYRASRLERWPVIFVSHCLKVLDFGMYFDLM